jgi:membrane protein involved in colicin uptake
VLRGVLGAGLRRHDGCGKVCATKPAPGCVVPEARKKAVPEARKKAVPEARKKAVPEARKKAVPEARKKAVPEARKKAVPEARKNDRAGGTSEGGRSARIGGRRIARQFADYHSPGFKHHASRTSP